MSPEVTGGGNMGCEYRARCKHCGHEFMVCEGGGFYFELLHCSTCGDERGVSHDDMGDLLHGHVKFILLSHPNSAELLKDELAQRVMAMPGEPVDDEEYSRRISLLAGPCSCGGTFQPKAPARCPKCRSSEFEDTGEELAHYD